MSDALYARIYAETIAQWYKSDDPAVRLTAVEYWASDPEYFKAELEAAEADNNAAVRRVAQQALATLK